MDGEQTTLEQDGRLRSSHKSGHMTACTQRIELITRGERRRRWSIEEKRKRRGESTSELGLTICGRVAGDLGYRGWRRNRLTRCFW
jgi:hypothetical protein